MRAFSEIFSSRRTLLFSLEKVTRARAFNQKRRRAAIFYNNRDDDDDERRKSATKVSLFLSRREAARVGFGAVGVAAFLFFDFIVAFVDGDFDAYRDEKASSSSSRARKEIDRNLTPDRVSIGDVVRARNSGIGVHVLREREVLGIREALVQSERVEREEMSTIY
jgi:hypothetical protein